MDGDQRRQVAVAARLPARAARAARSPTESLIDELWGDNPPSTANNLVSIYVHRLKKLIGDTEGRMLVYRAPGYMLRIAPGDLDLEQFESLAAEGAGALAAGQRERAAELLGAGARPVARAAARRRPADAAARHPG